MKKWQSRKGGHFDYGVPSLRVQVGHCPSGWIGRHDGGFHDWSVVRIYVRSVGCFSSWLVTWGGTRSRLFDFKGDVIAHSALKMATILDWPELTARSRLYTIRSVWNIYAAVHGTTGENWISANTCTWHTTPIRDKLFNRRARKE